MFSFMPDDTVAEIFKILPQTKALLEEILTLFQDPDVLALAQVICTFCVACLDCLPFDPFYCYY